VSSSLEALPSMRPGLRIFSFTLALGAAAVIAWLVFRGSISHALTLAWVASFLLFLLATRFRRPESRRSPRAVATLLFAAALPVAVRAANMDPDRLHGDDFITAYFSATHDFAHTSFFGNMPEYWQWQAQFPKPFFFLQRVFFTLFGEGTSSLSLSVQIYVAIVSVMLFLIVRDLLDTKSGLVAVVLYAFLAPSVYLETLGFMFVSSTAILAVFFYFALREYRSGEMFHAAMSGVACGFCYLTYYSSYLAFPLLVAFAAARWLRLRSARVLYNFVIALGGMFVVLAPFVAEGLRSGDYISRRANEVSLLTGTWSTHRDAIAKGASPLPAIRGNLVLSLKSFVRDGIGGHGGYDFGHLAFFDRFSLVLFLAGVLAALVLLWRRSELLFVFLAAGAAFVSGMVLTIPPPAYHRFSVGFPFLVIFMTLPLSLLLRMPKVPESVRYALVGGLLLVFASVNQRRFTEAVFRDHSYDELRLAELLNQRYGSRKLYVAAFPAYSFQKIFYFRDKWKDRQVESEFHDNLLKKFNPREKYVYVIILPDPFVQRFEKADPNGRFSRFSVGYSLFAN
jgi:hypothetical protein